ncbi:MAG TPA: cupin domain-containing protein [Candidatus Binatia bacterium]
MLQRDFYRETERELIIQSVRAEGFHPLCISAPPGRVYAPHSHAETKLLVFLKGGMRVTVAGEDYQCDAGDRLVIQGNVEHSAVAGPEGCVFLWSERLEKPSS